MNDEEMIEDLATYHEGRFETSRQSLQQKNNDKIDGFLGSERREVRAMTMPYYYIPVLAWAFQKYVERNKWDVETVMGSRLLEPMIMEIDTGIDQSEKVAIDAQLMMKHGKTRIIATMDLGPRGCCSITLEGLSAQKNELDHFAEGVMAVAEKENFYRGKRLEFNGRLEFLKVDEKQWSDVILGQSIKEEIRANTIEFLKRGDEWERFGIPAKRGVLLSGEPGTGKTIICRALMTEAEGVTCILANAYRIDENEYISTLYEIAQDLAPCLVFIEDIDLFAQERNEFGYTRGPVLISLLAEMDGVEEKKQIVTVATTNNLEMLDKAIKNRPSRFDRVVHIERLQFEERLHQVHRLCKKIPLSLENQMHVARCADGCTPAQVQEAVFGLVVEHHGELSTVTHADIEHILSRLDGRHGQRLGFMPLKEPDRGAYSRNELEKL